MNAGRILIPEWRIKSFRKGSGEARIIGDFFYALISLDWA